MVFPLKMTDKMITDLLATVNCTPQKFQHGDTANHVWYWAADNKARKDALDMAYKIKGRYSAEKHQVRFTDDLEDTPTDDIIDELHRRKQNTDGSTGKKPKGKKKK